ncbi:MAG: FMN-binding protein [Deltaproteobacteria bacterium]|nr:MAG: FMN-binding protein [Deltaproteobacteria bacterium]
MEEILTDNTPVPSGRIRNSNLAQAWLVLVLALIIGAILAAVQVRLSPIIAANKLNETLEKVPELVLGAGSAATRPSGLEVDPGTVKIEKDGPDSFYSVFHVVSKGAPAGWVVKTVGQGYGDKIELLIGFNPDITAITGIFVLGQKETPGLGANIASLKWRQQFIGKATARPLSVVKGGASAPNEIDAITGATISSRSVVGLVNRTTKDLAGKLTPEIVRFSRQVKKND